MLNFVFIRGVVNMILVTGVEKNPKSLNLSQKMDFSWKQNLAILGSRKAPHTGRKYTHFGARRRGILIFGANFWGLGGFLDPCDQNETYYTSKEYKIEHMNEA